MHNYASLLENQDHEEQGILFHTSEPTRSRFTHIDDLDSFFKNVYLYHQRHGFYCTMLQELLSIHQFIFIVCFSLYVVYGIDYNTLFHKEIQNKLHLSDVMFTVSECISHFTLITWIVILMALAALTYKVCHKLKTLVEMWNAKQFYNTVLNIHDKDLDNLTWYDVQTKLKAAQLEQQMCIHKRELTDLDIYHRILRQENYIVALVNKRLIPPRMQVPLLGEIVYWTSAFRLNVMWLLFWSPWSPFDQPWHLREAFKRQSLRQELATQLRRHITLLAILNLFFSPLVIIWQVLFYFFNYFELVRREPGKFGARYWSPFAFMYLRHFNELDHELHARLTRATRPAAKYLSAFSSPMATALAQHLAFLFGSILGVFLVLSFYDNDVIYVGNMVTIGAFLTGAIAVCRALVPDETMVWCPETLMEAVVSQIHYMQCDWKGKAHTSQVRAEFQQLFQYRFAGLLEELLSPIMTPFLLQTYLRPRSYDIIDFFHNFTVSVVGVGDVCSFAQMDIRRHGNPEWHTEETIDSVQTPRQYEQAEDGKVELSLIHFTQTNPNWKPPPDAQDFVDSVNEETNQHAKESEPQILKSVHNLLGSSMLLDMDLQSFWMYHDMNRGKSLVTNHAWDSEGPDRVNTNLNLRSSIMALHNRRKTMQDNRRTRSVEETTPLLSSK